MYLTHYHHLSTILIYYYMTYFHIVFTRLYSYQVDIFTLFDCLLESKNSQIHVYLHAVYVICMINYSSNIMAYELSIYALNPVIISLILYEQCLACLVLYMESSFIVHIMSTSL
jgi:sRNA-binding regulator protein Hfq